MTTRRNSLRADIGAIRGVAQGLQPTFLEPSLASPCDTPPSGPKWVHEVKYDGYRMQARIDGEDIRLLTRKKLDWTNRFRRIATALEELNVGSALLDGEIVAEDENGISSFNALQSDLKAGRQDRLRYHVFDILYCDGFDLTRVHLIERKALLERLVRTLSVGSPVRFSEHLEEDGPTLFEHARRLGLEGIVSKRKDLPYRPGRGEHWFRCKCLKRQEFAILGYIPSTAASGSVGSLLLGYQASGKLFYAGRVGTGWSANEARSLCVELEKLASAKPIFGKPLAAGADKGVRWAELRLVCEIEYHHWTGDGLLYAASFKGLREDKSPDEVVLEEASKPLDRG